jgi:hypothetical protein
LPTGRTITGRSRATRCSCSPSTRSARSSAYRPHSLELSCDFVCSPPRSWPSPC